MRWEQTMLAKQYRAMEAAGFAARSRRAKDVELALRLDEAGSSSSTPPLRCHDAERSYQAWPQNAFDYGRNDVIFGRDMRNSWLLEFTASKRRSHHVVVRAAIATCADRPTVPLAFVEAVSRLPVAACRLRCERVAGALLSVVYGMEYYRGVFGEPGRSDEVRTLVGAAAAGNVRSDPR